MMVILAEMIAHLAALLLRIGIPAPQTTLYALILIYLLVTGFLAGFLIFILLRRRQRDLKNIPPSGRES